MEVPKEVYDTCPSCSPGTYVETTFTYTGKKEKVTKDDGYVYEYLYECDKCKTKLWIYEDDAARKEVNK